MLDNQNLIIDTLINNSYIAAALKDENSTITQQESTTIEMEYYNFEDVAKIYSIASFNSYPENEFVEIYNDYEIDIILSARIKRKIE